jgi:hypothetical protein
MKRPYTYLADLPRHLVAHNLGEGQVPNTGKGVGPGVVAHLVHKTPPLPSGDMVGDVTRDRIPASRATPIPRVRDGRVTGTWVSRWTMSGSRPPGETGNGSHLSPVLPAGGLVLEESHQRISVLEPRLARATPDSMYAGPDVNERCSIGSAAWYGVARKPDMDIVPQPQEQARDYGWVHQKAGGKGLHDYLPHAHTLNSRQ